MILYLISILLEPFIAEWKSVINVNYCSKRLSNITITARGEALPYQMYTTLIKVNSVFELDRHPDAHSRGNLIQFLRSL